MEADSADSSMAAGLGGAGLGRLGERLSAARAAAGLDLADIARETRVPLRHLRAIEADMHDELPALPYTVGFVKSYARVVGLDPDEAAARFRAETSKTAHVPVIMPLEPLDERRLPPRGLVAASVAVLVLVLGGLTAYGAGWFDAAPVTEAVPVLAAAEPELEAEAEVLPPPGGTPAAMPAVVVDQPAAASGTVSITANEDAWIRVYRISPETGRPVTVRTGVLSKGQRYDVPPGETALRLWTGRAGALQVSLGGRALPPLGGPVETVRNVSLDPADLAARLSGPPAAVFPGVR